MISRTWILLTALVWGGPAGAHAQSWSASRVDSHAPLGVMGDHTHEAGEWMLSFRAMRMVMDGNRTDTARVPADGVLVGYPVTPLRMPMDMYMVGAMYAPTDRLTLVHGACAGHLDGSSDANGRGVHDRVRRNRRRQDVGPGWRGRARASGRTCTWA